MEIYVVRKKSSKGYDYLALEARAQWGRVILSFDAKAVLQILPYGVDHRKIAEEGVKIGYISDKL